MTDLEKVLARQPIQGPLEIAAGGKMVDGNGREICTINLKALTLSEAWAFASLFRAAVSHCDAVVAAEREATK